MCCLLNCPICLVCLCGFSEWVDISVMEQEAAVAARGKKRQDRLWSPGINSPEHNPNLQMHIFLNCCTIETVSFPNRLKAITELNLLTSLPSVSALKLTKHSSKMSLQRLLTRLLLAGPRERLQRAVLIGSRQLSISPDGYK